MTDTVLAAAPTAAVHRSRWGYHPCDRETFLLLRTLARRYRAALRGYHDWLRWSRKAPQNRVVRRWLRDPAGRKVGCEVVGPRPEPPLCPVFVRQETEMRKWVGGTFHRDPVPVPVEDDGGVLAAYAAARYPVADPAAVRPLGLTGADIQRLLAASAPAG